MQLPVALSPAAAVNAVMTATEAKTQALLEAGVPGTGTASDAVAIVSRVSECELEVFGGPRSLWGTQITLTTHDAITTKIKTTKPLINNT